MNIDTFDRWLMYRARCKDCGKPFHYTEEALAQDTARGLSPPERCPPCRKANAHVVSSFGAAYWKLPRPAPGEERLLGKYGLGLRVDPGRDVTPLPFGAPPESSVTQKFSRISPAVRELIRNLESPYGTQVSILVAPTGTGKSVWSTSEMIRSSVSLVGPICVTQPRLVTLRQGKDSSVDTSTPGYVGRTLLGAPAIGAGCPVGVLYRGESTQFDRYTRLLFVTDGIVIRWLLSGEIGRFSVLMIDEAHEQSANMEMIFALLRYKLPLYPRLKVVIASATVDVDRFRRFFGGSNPSSVFVAEIGDGGTGTPKTIHDRWPSSYLNGKNVPSSPEELPTAIADIVRRIRGEKGFTRLGDPFGDVIAFVPTVSLVKRTADAVRGLGLEGMEVLPCHAQMTDTEHSAFMKSEHRARKAFGQGQRTVPQRTIIATNYAETSVTLTNLRYVIDSGYILKPNWNATTSSREYVVVRHSQAGCTQRKGRVGRVAEGEVFRLYTEFEFATRFPKHPRPAMEKEPFDKFLLTAKLAGVEELETFSWLGYDPSSETHLAKRQQAMRSLIARGALTQSGELTQKGVELEAIETDTVDLAFLVSESDLFGCALEMASFLSFLDQPRTLFSDDEKGLLGYQRLRAGCRDDVEFYLRLFYHYERHTHEGDVKHWSNANGLNLAALDDVKTARSRLLRQFTRRTHSYVEERELDLERLYRVRFFAGCALPEWVYIGSKSIGGKQQYLPKSDACPCRLPVGIDRDSACNADPSLDAFVCLERVTVGNTVLAKHVIRLEPEWIGLSLKSPVSRALAAKKCSRLAGTAMRTADRIRNIPWSDIGAHGYSPGQLLTLLCIRSAEERTAMLVCDQARQRFAVSEIDRRTFEPGAQFRAFVQEVRGDRLILTSRGLAQLYKKGEEIRGAVISDVTKRDDGSKSGFLIDLEPGVRGFLPGRAFARKDGIFAQLEKGHRITVVVESNDSDRVEFVLPKPEVGKSYEGRVHGLHIGRTGYREAAFVEFIPGKVGFLHVSDSSRSRLNLMSVGETIHVTLEGIEPRENGRTNYRLAE